MKRVIFIVSLVISLNAAFSQTDSTLKSSLHDSILNKIYSFLPKGWIVSEGKEQIIFQRIDSIYSLEEYRFGTAHTGETKAERNERIKKDGKRCISKIILRYENRWSYTKILTSKNNNAYYLQKLQGLAQKYNITSLYNKELSTKQTPIYVGTTDKEKDAIKKYEKEYAEIMAKITTIPNYSTEKFSFFLVSTEGLNDDNHYVLPDEASLQLYKILSLFFEFSTQ